MTIKIPAWSEQTVGPEVDEDLEVGKGARIKTFDDKLVVKGSIILAGGATFDCNVEALNVEGEGNITVRGSLKVLERLTVKEGGVRVSRDLEAIDIDVDRFVEVDGSLRSSTVDVGGSLKVRGRADVEMVNVGGAVTFSGDSKAGRISVGGSLLVKGRIDCEKINVGGTVTLGKGEGGEISVGGSLRVRGYVTFNGIDVGGKVRVEGDAKGGDIDVGGSLKVDGDVELKGSLDVGGKVDVAGTLSATSVDVGGSLESKRIIASRVSVGKRIETEDGVKADRFSIGKGGEVRGPIKAKHAVIGPDAEVEDIEAEEVTLRRGSRAKNIKGKRIRVEDGCYIDGEVVYSQELSLDPRAKLMREPVKRED